MRRSGSKASKLVAVGADHGGFKMKEELKGLLLQLGHKVQDFGTDSEDAVDYPDFAKALGLALRDGQADRGVLLCGSGVGASVAVNKIPGIRGGLCHDSYSAHQGVEHDDMNVLVLGARVIGLELAKELVGDFLRAKFTAEERHNRRLAKVKALESETW